MSVIMKEKKGLKLDKLKKVDNINPKHMVLKLIYSRCFVKRSINN